MRNESSLVSRRGVGGSQPTGNANGGRPLRGRTARIASRLSTDQRLAGLAAQGDRQAFAAIYERYHAALHRYCRSIVRDADEASDALQNTMAQVLRALPGERRRIELRPWLFRIAHNESVSLLRQRRPQVDISEAAVLEQPSMERDVAAREEVAQLSRDLRDLPERQRGALVMRELTGLSFSEIAQAFGMSPDAAKQAVYDARCSLRAQAAGRAVECEVVRRAISDRDGRRLRSRKLRAHLRDCQSCRRFRSAIAPRREALAAIAPPIPAAATAGLRDLIGADVARSWAGLIGGGGKAAGGSLAVKAAVGAASASLTVATGAFVVGTHDHRWSASEQGGRPAEEPPIVSAGARPSTNTVGIGPQSDADGREQGTTARDHAGAGRGRDPSSIRRGYGVAALDSRHHHPGNESGEVGRHGRGPSNRAGGGGAKGGRSAPASTGGRRGGRSDRDGQARGMAHRDYSGRVVLGGLPVGLPGAPSSLDPTGRRPSAPAPLPSEAKKPDGGGARP
jgi:RNA polymerase sigma factor (sigma-70 family)